MRESRRWLFPGLPPLQGSYPVNSPCYPHTVKLCFVNPILSWCNCHKGNSCHSKGVSPVNSPGYPHTIKLCFVNPILSWCNYHKGNRHRQTDRLSELIYMICILEVHQSIQTYTPNFFLSYINKCKLDNSWFFCKLLLGTSKGYILWHI